VTGALTWEDDWLVLRVGPWAVNVGFIETYSDGTAKAFLYAWTVTPGDAWIAMPKLDKPAGGAADYGTVEVPCSSADEAGRVIHALLEVRGVVVPAWVP